MAKDALGNITSLAEIALLAGLAYVGYKVYKDFFPNKDKPPGDTPPGPAETAGQVAQVIIDTANTPVPSTGSQGQDFLRSLIIPKPLLQIGVKLEQWGDSNLGGVPGYKEARGLNDWLVKSPLVQWNPAFPQFYGNVIDLFLGKGTPPAQAATPTPNSVNATRAIAQVRTQGFASIIPKLNTTPVQINTKPPEADPKVTKSQSMGGTGSEIRDTPGILDYINIGPAKQSELEPKYRTPAAPVVPTTDYWTDGINRSSTPVAGWQKVTVNNLIPTKTEPPKPVTIPAPPPAVVNPVASGPINQTVLPAGQVSYNWQSGQVSRYLLTGPGWMQISEAEARARGMIK